MWIFQHLWRPWEPFSRYFLHFRLNQYTQQDSGYNVGPVPLSEAMVDFFWEDGAGEAVMHQEYWMCLPRRFQNAQR